MLEVRGVTVACAGATLLDVGSLVFRRGCVTTILGLNGSGKTTLLRAMLNLVRHSGVVTLDGRSVGRMGHRERARRIAWLPQQTAAPNMDAQTLVSHGCFARLGFSKVLGPEDAERVQDAMRQADIWEKRAHNVRELSGGERQRAYLAMVIAQDTPFLLLDEPGTYMDIRHQADVMALLSRLAAAGKGIVMTSHDLPQSFTASDAVCVLRQGRVAAFGTAAEIAAREDVLRESLGVSVSALEGGGYLYPYAVMR